MIKRKQLIYAAAVLLTIATGLLSRRLAFIPAATGDALYAVMIYFILRCLWPQRAVKNTALAAMLLCFMIEFSQCYHAVWIDKVRATLAGRLILGQGFLWSDLLAYVLGTAFALLIDKLVLIKKNKKVAA